MVNCFPRLLRLKIAVTLLVVLVFSGVFPFTSTFAFSGDSWVWVRDTVTGAYGEAAVGTGDAVYIARKNSFYRFSPADNSWTGLADPPNPDSKDAFKTGTALAWDFSDYIYALYGAATDDSRRWFYRYSISGDSWTALANTTFDQGEGDAITWVSSENCIYATIGGEQRSTIFMRYDPSTDSWSDAPAEPPAGMGDGASLVWTGGDFLYALRGEFYEEEPLYDFWRYSISQNVWVSMADIPADNHDSGSGGVGDGGSLLYIGFWMSNQTDSIYALSGNQAFPDGIADNRTYRYTMSTDGWERLADLPFGVGYYVGCRLGYTDGHIYAWQGTPSTWTGGGDDLAKYEFPTAAEGTLVGGHISHDVTWTLENSPYLFVDDVTVDEGVTLTIEQGVTVDLDLWNLRIDGTLYARGNESKKIEFHSLERPIHARSRIYFSDSSRHWTETNNTGCIIEYAEISVDYGFLTIGSAPGAYPKISNNVIYSGIGGIRTDGKGIVSNNTIIGDGDFFNFNAGIVAGNGLIAYNIIKGMHYGVSVGGTMPGPTRFPTVVGNLIIDNCKGIAFSGPSSPCITNNTIVRNMYGFCFTEYAFYQGVMPSAIIYNNIDSNSYDVKVEKEDPRITINMTYNWWGTTNTSLIDQKIYDQKDNRRLCLLNYTPFLTSPAFSLDFSPPVTIHDYDGSWHNADYFISLNATDALSGVAETYYKINEGSTKSISIDGQPHITTESSNNTLQYWSVDNTDNEEFPHKILTGIRLDKTAPTVEIPSRIPENDVEPDQEVKVSVNVTDSMSGVKSVRLKYSSNRSVLWLDFPMTFNSTTGLWEFVIPGQQANTLVKYRIEAYDNALNHKVDDNSGQYYVYTVIPEFPQPIILLLFAFTTLIATILLKKKARPKSPPQFSLK